MRFSIDTFGCQMNRHDSEHIAGLLESLGHERCPDDQAELIVVNSCSVREKAETRVAGHLSRLAVEKTGPGPLRHIVLSGCFAESGGERLLDTFPSLDAVIGTRSIGAYPQVMEALQSGERSVFTGMEAEGFTADLPSVREEAHRAWVTIAEGCDNRCSYCIVPSVRGGERSRPMADVLSEVSRLTEDGAREINLLGQNVDSYKAPEGGDFGELIMAVDAIPGIGWVRFMTSHPRDMSARAIAAIAGSASACRHVHLPVQSGSDQVLGKMGRGYTAASYLALLESIRLEMPDVAVTTDIIVGYPGESEEDFSQTLQLVEEAGFDNAFTFIYSPRSGTAAALLADDVPREEKVARLSELVRRQVAVSESKNAALIGVIREAMLEGESRKGKGMRLRLRDNRVVDLLGNADMPPLGSVLPVRITGAGKNALGGELEERR